MASLARDVDCLAREGRWVPYNRPRPLPWSKIEKPHPEHPNYGTCDMMHEK